MQKFDRKYELTVSISEYLQTDAGGNISFTKSFGSSNQSIRTFALSNVQGGFESSIKNSTPDTIRIKNPITIDFSIHRRAMASSNVANIKIYNLSEATRNLLYKDFTDFLCMRKITLRAGYEEPLPIILEGNVLWCISYRMAGSTDFITEIEAFDYSFATVNSYSKISRQNKIQKQEIVDQLVKDICAMGPQEARVRRGAIRTFAGEVYNSVMMGNSWELLRQWTDHSCFIDNGTLNILNDNEYFGDTAFLIDSFSGLLGTPKRSEGYVEVEMLFEPSILIGQMARLDSESQTMFNGDYKVVGILHEGRISGAMGGSCSTKVSLWNFRKMAQLVSSSRSLV